MSCTGTSIQPESLQVWIVKITTPLVGLFTWDSGLRYEELGLPELTAFTQVRCSRHVISCEHGQVCCLRGALYAATVVFTFSICRKLGPNRTDSEKRGLRAHRSMFSWFGACALVSILKHFLFFFAAKLAHPSSTKIARFGSTTVTEALLQCYIQ